MRVVKAFARRAAPARALPRTRSRRVFDQAMFATRLSAFYSPFIGFLPQLGLAAILFVGGRQVINGDLTAGDFAAFYTYLLMLISPMRSLGIALGFAQRATASGARLFEILDREPRLQSRARRAAAARRQRARRAARRLVRLRGRRRRSCATSTSTVDGGTTVALVGATGSGKTTLVQLLGRLYDVDRGRVLIDGADVRDVDAALAARADRRRHRRPVPVQRDRPRQHRLRRARTRRARRSSARPSARRPHGFIARAARRLRHRRRRARPDALRRPAPADRDRARAAGRPAHPRPRRRHLVGRRLDRAGDQAGAARGDARPHDVRDRPPALDDRAGRRRSSCSRTARSPPAARTTSCCAESELYAEIAARACPTRSSSPATRSSAGGGPVSGATQPDEPRRPTTCAGACARPAGAGASCAG